LHLEDLFLSMFPMDDLTYIYGGSITPAALMAYITDVADLE
jgi:hypothetical protein